MEPRVAVIILNWNGEKLLKEFLPSVVNCTDPDLARIVVADNASADHSVDWVQENFPNVRILRLEENFGFAGGYNRAIAEVEDEVVVLLNSDVEVTPDWLQPLIGTLDQNPGVAAVQPKIKAYKEKEKFEYAGACGGYIDYLGFPFCRGRMLNVTEVDGGQYDDVAEVFWCSGAALCIRREAYLQAGGLDERFFAHMEEIDLCWRLRNLGWGLKVVPASTVYHLGGGSLPVHHPKKLFLNYRNNFLMLYKNLPSGKFRRVMFWRWWLDTAAMGMFLLKGQWRNAKAIPAAYLSFRSMRKGYARPEQYREDPCMLRKSIIVSFYFCRIKVFSKLF